MSVKATPAAMQSFVDDLAAKAQRGEVLTVQDFKGMPMTASYIKKCQKDGIQSALVASNVDPAKTTPKGEKAKFPVTDEFGNKLVNVCKRKYDPITLGEFKAEIQKTTAKKSGTPRGQAFAAANPGLNEHQMYEAFLVQYKEQLAIELAERKAQYIFHSKRIYANTPATVGKILDETTGNWKEDPAIKEAAKQAKLAAKAAKATTPTPATPAPATPAPAPTEEESGDEA